MGSTNGGSLCSFRRMLSYNAAIVCLTHSGTPNVSPRARVIHSASGITSALRREEGAAAEGLEARHIGFRSGRSVCPWQGNVVAIGLSGGFLEPLESTGLFLADYASRVLLEMFPPHTEPALMQPLAQRFNDLMAEMYDDLTDYLALHYLVAGRRDTAFWQEASAPERASSRLRHLLSMWNLRPPSFADFSLRYAPFTHQNYEFILLGSGWRPQGAERGPSAVVLPRRTATLRRDLLLGLPDHEAALP